MGRTPWANCERAHYKQCTYLEGMTITTSVLYHGGTICRTYAKQQPRCICNNSSGKGVSGHNLIARSTYRARTLKIRATSPLLRRIGVRWSNRSGLDGNTPTAAAAAGYGGTDGCYRCSGRGTSRLAGPGTCSDGCCCGVRPMHHSCQLCCLSRTTMFHLSKLVPYCRDKCPHAEQLPHPDPV